MYSSKKTNMKTFPVVLMALGTPANGEREGGVESAWEWEVPQPKGISRQGALSLETGRNS